MSAPTRRLTHPDEADRLPLFCSPVVAEKSPSTGPTPASTLQHSPEQPTDPNLTDLGFRDGFQSYPEFEKHTEATNIEVFYDLFFAANLSVFGEAQDINDQYKLLSFIAYFSLMWFNWALLGMYDVRFVTDSIFERTIRAVHFGVMVGFAVIVPNFNVNEQKPDTLKTMSLVLMVSRLALSIQYASIWWHIRKFKNTRLPLGVMVGTNLVGGVVYLGMAFGFSGGNRAMYATWFVLMVLEAAVAVGASYMWRVLSFAGTHLSNRVLLLTFIFIGEGVVSVCLAVVRIVGNNSPWTPAAIGNVTVGIANLYILYMIYFDWSRNLSLGKYRLLIWSFLHFPFHLVVRMFIEGSSQFVNWWKVVETVATAAVDIGVSANQLLSNPPANTTTETFIQQINSTISGIFETYKPIYSYTDEHLNFAFEGLREEIPDSFWVRGQKDSAAFDMLLQILRFVANTVQNSIFVNFKIDGYGALVEKYGEMNQIQFENTVSNYNWGKFRLVFSYAHIAAGLSVILMTTLFIIKGPALRHWTMFNFVRKAINYAAGIALCLMSLHTRGDKLDPLTNYMFKPWPLPTITLILFFVLVLNHLPSPPPIFFRRRLTGLNKTGDGWNAVSSMGFRKQVKAEDGGSSDANRSRGDSK